MMARNAEIGEKIHYFRQEKGMTQSQLAKELGKTTRTVQKYEAGEIELTVVWLERIAEILSVHPSHLLGYCEFQKVTYAKARIQTKKSRINALILLYPRNPETSVKTKK